MPQALMRRMRKARRAVCKELVDVHDFVAVIFVQNLVAGKHHLVILNSSALTYHRPHQRRVSLGCPRGVRSSDRLDDQEAAYCSLWLHIYHELVSYTRSIFDVERTTETPH